MMPRRWRVASALGLRWAIALGLIAAPATAQDGRPDSSLTLREAVNRALAVHPSIRAAAAAVGEANALGREAAAARWPSLNLAASATQFQEPMLVTPIHGLVPGQTPPFDETLIQAGVTVGYTLFDGGARGARIKQARARSDLAAAAANTNEQILVGAVVASYLGVLARRDVLAAHDRRLTAIETERSRVGQLLAVGRAAEVDRLRAEAALAEGQAARVRLAQDLELTERTLGRLIAADQVRAASLQEVGVMDSVVPDRGETVAIALGASPAVEQARRQVAAAEAGIAVTRGVRWPALQVVGNYVDRGSAQGDYQGEWNAGVQLAYPLFTGGAIGSREARARSALAGAVEALALAKLDATGLVDVALAAIRETRARAGSLERAVAAFAEVARIEQLRLSTEVGTQAEYFRAEADLLAARAELAGARYGELRARADLARAMGRLSPTWVATTLEIRR